MRKYSIKTLRQDFPDDDACLDFVFRSRWGNLPGYYRIKDRKEYVNAKGEHVYPLAGTIFHRTRVPLTTWFHAIYLFTISKNGVSAAELSRQLGLTYKCAFRMGHLIRSIMQDNCGQLEGTVQIDETYIGGKHYRKYGFSKKKPVLGMVQTDGRVRAMAIPHRGTEVVLPLVKKNVSSKTHIMTDEARVYGKLPRFGYSWSSVKHGKRHWKYKGTTTNTIEGFWGHLKPSLKGTYRGVSHKYLQLYLSENVWRYNRRKKTSSFDELLDVACGIWSSELERNLSELSYKSSG